MSDTSEPASGHGAVPTVVAVCGSPRADGNSSHLVDVAIAELERSGLHCEKVMIGEHRIQPCEGHDDCADLAVCPLDDDACALLDRVYAADGLLFATPVYYEDMSAQLKLFIDRNCFNNYHGTWLSARSVGLIAVAESTGLDETIAGLERYIALASQKRIKPLSTSGMALPGWRCGRKRRIDGVGRAHGARDGARAGRPSLARRGGRLVACEPSESGPARRRRDSPSRPLGLR